MKYLPLLLIILTGCSQEEMSIIQRSAADLIFSPDPSCINERIAITFDNGQGNNCGESRIEVLINNEWRLLDEEVPVNGIATAEFQTSQEGVYQVRGSYRKKGNCRGHNVKVAEDLVITTDCCQNYLISQSVCSSNICQYGVEFWLMVDHNVYATMTGVLPPEADLCGFYDENNNLVVPMSGNEFYIEGDLYGCQVNHFFVYFNSPYLPTSTWSVRYDGGSMISSPIPCVQ